MNYPVTPKHLSSAVNDIKKSINDLQAMIDDLTPSPTEQMYSMLVQDILDTLHRYEPSDLIDIDARVNGRDVTLDFEWVSGGGSMYSDLQDDLQKVIKDFFMYHSNLWEKSQCQ